MASLPTTPGIQRCRRMSLAPTTETKTHSLKSFVDSIGAQEFSFEVTWRPCKEEAFRALDGFLCARAGKFGTFNFVDPSYNGPFGELTGALRCQGISHSAGSTSIAVSCDSAANAAKTILKVGDLIRFAGHAKVYTVVANCTVDSSATPDGTLTIFPGLQFSTISSEAIYVSGSNFYFTVSLDDDSYHYDAEGLHYFMGARFVEANIDL